MSSPAPRIVLLVLASLMVAVSSPSISQNQKQTPGKPPASTVGTVGTVGIRNPNGGGDTNPTHTTSGGGGHTGAIVGGAVGAAAAGIAVFELLHHAHAADSGKPVERLKLTLRYPEDWQLNPGLNQQDDPISFNNFNNSYLQGGIIPPGGADIDIARFPATNRKVADLIASELSDADQKKIDSHPYKIGDQQGTRVYYSDTYAPQFTYKNVAIYVATSDALYKFFLTYHQGDQHEKSFNDDFEHMLKSVRFER